MIHFKNHAVANDRSVTDAVIMLTLLEEMELIHAFLICVCYWYILKARGSTWYIGNRCCYNVDSGRRNEINRCICSTCVCYWYILKAYKSIWQIGDEYCDYTGIRNGIYRYFITHVFDNDTFWKHVVAHDDWWWMLLL